jgi:hypothetical protein
MTTTAETSLTETTLAESFTPRWYAAKPFAYKIRDDYRKRMSVGLLTASLCYGALIGGYFINQSIPMEQTKKFERVIDVTQIPPPPPIEIKTETPTDASKKIAGSIAPVELPNGGQVADASAKKSDELNLAKDYDLNTKQGREAFAQSVEQQVESAIGAALAGGIFAETDGLAKPTMGAIDDGAGLLNGTKSMGLRNLNTGVGLGASLGLGGGRIGFGATTNGGGRIGFGALNHAGLGGSGITRGLNATARLGTLLLKSDMQNLAESSDARSKDDILSVVKSHQEAIMAAYRETRRETDENLHGAMTFRIMIRPDGAVARVELVKSAIRNDDLERRVRMKLCRMTFSTIEAQVNQTVEIPYQFSEEI